MAADKKATILSIGGIILVVGLMVLGGRVIIRKVGNTVRMPEKRIEIPATEKEVRETGDIRESRYEVDEFDSLDIRGIWNIIITQGESYSIKVRARDSKLQNIDMIQRGKEIVLHQTTSLNFLSGTPLEVTVPELSRLKAEGGSQIVIKGFDGSSMILQIDGMATVTGSENRIDNLRIMGEGAGSINLLKSTVVNADLFLQGLVNVKLHMGGGTLKGRIEGLCSLSYSGNVEEESIKLDGLGSVKKME